MNNIFKDNIVRSSFLVLLFSGVAHILNYAYTLVAIHFLNPIEYSELALLISIYSLIGIFGATISNISLPLLHDVENLKIKKQVIAVTKFLSIILLFLSFTLIPFLVYKIFNIENIQNIILFSVGGTATLATALLTTHLQVVKNFFKVGLIQVFNTFIKFIGSFILLYFGYKIFGVGLALLLASVFSFIIFFPWTSENKKFLPTSSSLRFLDSFTLVKTFWQEHKNFLIKSFLGSLVLTLLFSIDTILAKKLLHEDIVGYFVGIATLSKLFLFGIIAISTVVFPYILSENSKEKQKSILNYFLIFTLLSGTIWLLIAYIGHETLVPLILGKKYLDASVYLFPVSFSIVMASFAYIFTQLSILLNTENFIKTILFYFAMFTISFLIFVKHLIPNLSAINIINFSNFLSLMFAILAVLLYYTKSRI